MHGVDFLNKLLLLLSNAEIYHSAFHNGRKPIKLLTDGIPSYTSIFRGTKSRLKLGCYSHPIFWENFLNKVGGDMAIENRQAR